MTKKIWKLPQVKNLRKSLFLSKTWRQKVKESISRLQNIISWKLDKKILIIWPCSADFDSSLFEYAWFLKEMKEKYSDKLEIVMRFYTGKPRTTVWWKGILHSEPGKSADLKSWIKHSRKTAIKLIEDYNMSLADELLYPELSSRLWDLYSYMAIWARSTENQFHREVASWLIFPVWIKNPTSWDLSIMNNSIIAAKASSNYVMERVIYETSGNSSAHGILRWWSTWPNFSEAKDYSSPLIVDCNHENSGKDPNKQIEIMKEVMWYKNDNIKGFMVESYLFDGRQDYSGTCKKWLSLTDPCTGKENTKKFIKELYDLI